VTWDDHEVANDYAGDIDERLSGDFAARRAAAYQAFYEHMPLRLPPPRDGRFGSIRMYQRYDWGGWRASTCSTTASTGLPCPARSRGVAARTSCWRAPARRCATRAHDAGQRSGSMAGAGPVVIAARWNILAQQTPMAQSSGVPVRSPEDGRFWTDGWDGYPVARRRLLDALVKSGASNPVVLAGDVHTFYASELRRDFGRPVSKANPVIAAEFCGTSVTSSSRPQSRTQENVERNPHMLYGRSDTRGYTLLEITPQSANARFMGLDDVRVARSGQTEMASFSVDDGAPGLIVARIAWSARNLPTGIVDAARRDHADCFSSRSSRRRILPTFVFGSVSRNSIRRGRL
jgi:alkaline phosphatase D